MVTGSGCGLPFLSHTTMTSNTLVVRNVHMALTSILEVLAASSITLVGMHNTVSTWRMIYKCLLVSNFNGTESQP